MSRAITHVFFDLDGTLVDDRKKLSPETQDYLSSLKQRKGITLGIATGRNIKSVRRLLDQNKAQALFDYLIVDNGAEIVNVETGSRVFSGRIAPQEIQEIIDAYQNRPEITVAFHNEHSFCATQLTNRVIDIMKLNGVDNFVDISIDNSYEETARVMLLLDESVSENEVFETFDGLKGVRPVDDIFEYMHDTVSKHNAIQEVADPSKSKVMVFGDSENDIEMLQGADWSVAMLNANAKIKHYANDVTTSTNNETGIVDYLMSIEPMFDDDGRV